MYSQAIRSGFFMSNTAHISIDTAWQLLNTVPDPEIPAISIVELGVVRRIEWVEKVLHVIITPTYTGCPATNMFEKDIVSALRDAGVADVKITHQFSPAWTTDWLSQETREKLRAFGIAPPEGNTTDKRHLLGQDPIVKCINCGSENTKMISQFGSTACKSLYTL